MRVGFEKNSRSIFTTEYKFNRHNYVHVNFSYNWTCNFQFYYENRSRSFTDGKCCVWNPEPGKILLVESGHPELWKVSSLLRIFFWGGGGGAGFLGPRQTRFTLRERIEVFCTTRTQSNKSPMVYLYGLRTNTRHAAVSQINVEEHGGLSIVLVADFSS